jgi:hypothetical protein
MLIRQWGFDCHLGLLHERGATQAFVSRAKRKSMFRNARNDRLDLPMAPSLTRCGIPSRQAGRLFGVARPTRQIRVFFTPVYCVGIPDNLTRRSSSGPAILSLIMMIIHSTGTSGLRKEVCCRTDEIYDRLLIPIMLKSRSIQNQLVVRGA